MRARRNNAANGILTTHRPITSPSSVNHCLLKTGLPDLSPIAGGFPMEHKLMEIW